MAEYRGFQAFAKQPEEYTYNREAGFVRRVTYHGTPQAIQGLISVFVNGGYTFEANLQGPIASISGTLAQNPTGGDDHIDRHTIHQETLDQDVWSLEGVEEEAQAYATESGQSLGKYREVIETAVKEAKISQLTTNGLNVDDYPLAFQIYVELARGADTFENQFTILTRVRTVPIAWLGRLDLETVSKIYDQAGLFSDFSIDPLVADLLPAVPTTIAPNSVWGWRRRRQSIDYLDDGVRATLTQDWTFAQWSTFIYSLA